MDETRVILRPYDPDTDQGFIYSSWRNGLYYHTEPRNKGNPVQFFSQATGKINRTLEQSTVTIACFQNSPIVIVGYVAKTKNHLDWIYVKEDFRLRGIGRLLCDPSKLESVTDDTTRIGKTLLEKYKFKNKKNQEN